MFSNNKPQINTSNWSLQPPTSGLFNQQPVFGNTQQQQPNTLFGNTQSTQQHVSFGNVQPAQQSTTLFGNNQQQQVAQQPNNLFQQQPAAQPSNSFVNTQQPVQPSNSFVNTQQSVQPNNLFQPAIAQPQSNVQQQVAQQPNNNLFQQQSPVNNQVSQLPKEYSLSLHNDQNDLFVTVVNEKNQSLDIRLLSKGTKLTINLPSDQGFKISVINPSHQALENTVEKLVATIDSDPFMINKIFKND